MGLPAVPERGRQMSPYKDKRPGGKAEASKEANSRPESSAFRGTLREALG